MDRSYPYTRRVIQRARLQQRAAMLLAAGVAACALLYAALQPAPGYDAPALHAVPALSAMAPGAPVPVQAARRVYPYSIVPGGVSGRSDLARVIRTDKVVAAHYASFDVDKAQEKVVTTPRAVHVSYRKGDKVYWTAKKLMLTEGETLLSDGIHEARARCANRISDTPQLPVEAHGPSADELDSSVVENAPEEGSMQHVSAAMPDEDGGGAVGRFLHASGGTAGSTSTAGSGNAAANTAPGLSSAAYLAARDPVYWGGTLAASDSGSAGSRPAPGTTGDAPAADAPGSGGSTAASPAPAVIPTHTTLETPGQAGISLPALVAQPDGPLPGAPQFPAAIPVTTSILPGGLSGGGDQAVDPLLPGLPVGGGIELPPSRDPGDSPVPEPSLTQPALPVPVSEEAEQGHVTEPGSLWLAGAAFAAMLAQRRRSPRAGR